MLPPWRGSVQNWGLKMTKRDLTEAELGALFAAQREAAPPPSEAFLARISAQAAEAAAGAGRRAVPPTARRDRRWSWLAPLLAPAGVVAAGVLGVWIGLTGPQGLPDPALLWAAPAGTTALSDDTLLVFGAFETWEMSNAD